MLNFTGIIRISRLGWASECPEEERSRLLPMLAERIQKFFPDARIVVEDFRGRFEVKADSPEMTEMVRVAVDTIAVMLLHEAAYRAAFAKLEAESSTAAEVSGTSTQRAEIVRQA